MRGRFPLAMTIWAVALACFSTGAAVGAPLDSTAGPDLLGWETIDLEGATCGRGDPYRYFYNPADEPAGVLLFLMGGGACVKEGPPPEGVEGVAAQLHCMEYPNFAAPTDVYHLAGTLFPFFRRDSANPFLEWDWVIVPYCTGDVHAGVLEEPTDYDPRPNAEFNVIHRGRLNVLAVLDDLEERVPKDLPAVLTGSSAGGFGAIFNFPEVIRRWPNTALIPDAGIAPPAPDTLMRREGPTIARRWGARALLPSYCDSDECLADTLKLLASHADQHDGEPAAWRPFGYLQGQRDAVLAEWLETTPCTYQLALRDAAAVAVRPNLAAYLPATEEHTFLPRSAGWETLGGVQMSDWFARVAAADGPESMPADAVDRWQACNPIALPWLGAVSSGGGLVGGARRRDGAEMADQGRSRRWMRRIFEIGDHLRTGG